MQASLETVDAPAPGAYVPPSILPPEAEEDSPTGLILDYREPPIHRLPPPLSEYVATSAEAIGCDPSLIAMPALAACAAAIGDARALQVKPGFDVPAVLWTLVAAASGQLKTPAMKAATVGLEAAQREAAEKHRSAEARHKAALAEWSNGGRKGLEPEAPKMTHYYAGDATLESLWPIISDNPRGLLQKRDELSGWLGGFGRYQDGNDSEVSQWLELYDASSVKNDRKSGEKKNIYLPRVPVSVTGTIQVPILRNLLSEGDAKHFDNGLAPRFMMAMPPERPRRWSEAFTPPALVKQYVSLFQDLLALAPQIDPETGRRDPVLLHWSPEAKARWVQFFNLNGAEMMAFKEDRLKSAWSKIEGQAARLALVFHCVSNAYLPGPDSEARVISLDTLEAALDWVEWLKNETRRIYYTLTHQGQTRAADKLIQFARRNAGRCTAREAARVGAGGRDAKAVEKIMAGLVTAGFGEWELPESPKGGRPTRYFRLNHATPCRETDETHPQK